MLHKYYREYVRKFRRSMAKTLLITAIGILSVIFLFDSVFNGLILDAITVMNLPLLTSIYYRLYDFFILISISFGGAWIYIRVRHFVLEVLQLQAELDHANTIDRSMDSESMFDDIYEIHSLNKLKYQKAFEQEQESNRLKEQLINSLGNNLRLPIQKLKMHMKFIQEDIANEIVAKYQKEALQQATGLQVMLQETFQIANQQYYNTTHQNLQPTNIGRIMMQLLDEEQAMIEQKQIVVEMAVDGHVVIRADREAVTYLLEQALKNVLLYIGKGERLSITISRGAFVKVELTGYGTPLNDYEVLACKQQLLQYSLDEEAQMGFVYMEQMMKYHKGHIQISTLPRSLRIEMKFPG